MVYVRNKNFINIKPLLFPDKHYVVIAYKNIVEVHNIQHVIICKLENDNQVVCLEKLVQDQHKFYFALDNGDVKVCDITSFLVKDVMSLDASLKRIFVLEKALLSLEKDGAYMYDNFDLSRRSLVSSKFSDIIAFNGTLLASVNKRDLLVKRLGDEKEIRQVMSASMRERHYTCVDCHPSKNTVAAGDNKGAVTVWWDVLVRDAAFSILHWHFLELSCLQFSSDGSHLLTGGKEAVLIKWQLTVHSSDIPRKVHPRLEAPIAHIGAFSRKDGDGEQYLLTMDDHSYQVLTSQMWLVDCYRSVVQRPPFLHNKVSRMTGLSSVGLLDGSKLPGRLAGTLVASGHEGKLQFIDLRKDEVVDQLDVTCQNWPTETENHLIPGFIQVKKAAISSCGRFIGTFEKIGVAQNQYDEMSNVRIFQWSVEQDKFVMEGQLYWDNMDTVVDMVFHPNQSGHLMLVSKSSKLYLVSRFDHGPSHKVEWRLFSTTDLAEELRRHNVGLDHCKQHHRAVLATVTSGHNDSDGLLVVGSNGTLALFLWSHLLRGRWRPLAAQRTTHLMRHLRMGRRDRDRIVPDIVSVAVTAHGSEPSRYRLVCGLHRGLMVVEAAVRADGTVVMAEATGLAGDRGSCVVAVREGGVAAAVFAKEGRMAVFDVWAGATAVAQGYEVVPGFQEVVWTRSAADGRWVVAGLARRAHLVEIATVETPPSSLPSSGATNGPGAAVSLLAAVEDEEEPLGEDRRPSQAARHAKETAAAIRALLGYQEVSVTQAFLGHYAL